MKFVSYLSFPLTLALLAIFPPPMAHAAPFAIADGDVAGLIAAIDTANTTPGADTINLAPGGTYTLTGVNNTRYDLGPSGLPVITSQITINGNGATIERSNVADTPDFRILMILGGNATLDKVTIRGGRATEGSPGYEGGGGGIRNDGGVLLLMNSTVTGNSGASNGLSSGGNGGGGIFNCFGALTVVNSTISHNTGYGGRTGGGILSMSTGGNPPTLLATTTIINSTILENRADGPPGFEGRGDAIADNFSPPGSIVVKNSILASPLEGVGNDFYVAPGVVTSLGHNIVGDTSGALTGTGDLEGVDPQLGPLTDNGGLTWTHAPLPGSPVLDAVPTAECADAGGAVIATDQRGVARPYGAACDIGSVEWRYSVGSQACGGAAGDTCGEGQFCMRPEGECAEDAAGVCTNTLRPCLLIILPVCGCDGTTYANACNATSAGVTVDHAGECEAVGTDTTPPTITYTATPPTPDGANGWYKSNVTLGWNVTDSESSVTTIACIDQNITADQEATTYSCSATSDGGSSGPVDLAIKRDATAPTVSLSGAPLSGPSPYFGFLPAEAPTCSAADALSGVDGLCTVSGYTPTATVGPHDVTATARDQAGNQSSTLASYTVLPWTLNGFQKQVDMVGVNKVTGKKGDLKFNVWAGLTELTSTSVVNPNPVLTAHEGICSVVAMNIQLPASLKYVGGQFVYSWQWPNTSGDYCVTVRLADGTSKSASFKVN